MEGCSSCGGDTWRLRDVSLRRVFKQQDFGSIYGTAITLAALAITQACLEGPRERPFLVTDATISFPNNESTIPYWAAILASFAALVVTILLVELWLARRLHADITDAVSAAVHFIVDGMSAFAVTGLATTVSKMVVGRLRPDFLARCQPTIPNPLTTNYGLLPADNPACTAPPSGELTDGHYSFPSGHTSTVFVFSIWTAAYCTWAFYMRMPRKSARTMFSTSLGERFLNDMGMASSYLWIVALLAYAWAVGVSRITDFKHHPSDVLGGAFLGALFGVAFVVRAIARLPCVVVGLAAEGSSGDGTPQIGSLLLHHGNQVHHNGTASRSASAV